MDVDGTGGIGGHWQSQIDNLANQNEYCHKFEIIQTTGSGKQNHPSKESSNELSSEIMKSGNQHSYLRTSNGIPVLSPYQAQLARQ